MNKMRKSKSRYRSLSFVTLVCLVFLSACSVNRAPEVDKVLRLPNASGLV